MLMISICINNNLVSANGIDKQTFNDNKDGELPDASYYFKKFEPEKIELTRRGVWPRLFRSENIQPRINGRVHPTPTEAGYTSAIGRFHIIPFDKRTIPIELQKALYAHGIVGRRR